MDTYNRVMQTISYIFIISGITYIFVGLAFFILDGKTMLKKMIKAIVNWAYGGPVMYMSKDAKWDGILWEKAEDISCNAKLSNLYTNLIAEGKSEEEARQEIEDIIINSELDPDPNAPGIAPVGKPEQVDMRSLHGQGLMSKEFRRITKPAKRPSKDLRLGTQTKRDSKGRFTS